METGLLESFHLDEGQFSASKNYDKMHSSYFDNDLMNIDSHIMMFSSHENDEGGYENSYLNWSNEVLKDCYDESFVHERLINLGLDLLEKDTSLEQLEIGPDDFSRILSKDEPSSSENTPVKFEMQDMPVLPENFLENSAVSSILDSFEDVPFPSSDEQGECSKPEVSQQKTLSALEVQKKLASSTTRKRKRPKSFSVPHSPEHEPFKFDMCDIPSSFCFEDLNEVDFDQFVDNDINIKPEKAFNKSLSISDMIDNAHEDDKLEIKFDFPAKAEKNKAKSKRPVKKDVIKHEVKVIEETDSDDFIDVENLSDSESTPILKPEITPIKPSKIEKVETKGNKSQIKNSKKSKISSEEPPKVLNKPTSKPEKPVKNSADTKSKVKSTLKINQGNIYLDHDYCSASPIKNYDLGINKNWSNNKNKSLLRTSRDSLVNQPNDKNSLLKPIVPEQKKTPQVQNRRTTNSEHSYSRIDSMKRKEIKSQQESSKVQNVIVLENGTERLVDIGNDCKNFLKSNRTDSRNNNSLLINNLNKSGNKPKSLPAQTKKKSSSLLKPIVKDVKMVSLLKCNYKNQDTQDKSCDSNAKKKLDFESKSMKDKPVVNAKPIEYPTIPQKIMSMRIPKINPVLTDTVSKIFDPIAEATKKALRLKKKLAQKTDDEIIMRRIRKVSNSMILPLDAEDKSKEESAKAKPVVNSDYDEIILVSTGVNTEDPDNLFGRNYCPVKTESVDSKLSPENTFYHDGEDRIIMHLSKDRIRPVMKSIGVQTNVICPDIEIINQQLIAFDNIKTEMYDDVDGDQVDEKMDQNYIDLINRWKTDSVDGSSRSESQSRTSRREKSRDRHRRQCRNADSSKSEINGDVNGSGSEISPRRSRSQSVSSCSSRSSSSSSSSSCSSSNSDSSRSSASSYRSRRPSRPTSRSSRNTSCSRNPKIECKEERKVIYVGMLEQDMTVAELRRRFSKYGNVRTITFHTKTDGMRYGFVTFSEAQESYKVLENSSTDPEISHYDVFFGGRREFCRQSYADLDDIEALNEESDYYSTIVSRSVAPRQDNSFDRLLRETRAALNAKKMRNRRG